MKQVKHWQDPVNALLGAWLIVAPWALGFHADLVVAGNYVLVGVLLVAAAVGAIVLPKAWEEWVEVALGLWLLASPWALGFADDSVPMENALFCGLLVVVLALWVLASDEDYSGWWERLIG